MHYTPFISSKIPHRTHTMIQSSVICIQVLNILQNFSFCYFTETLQHSQLQQRRQNLKKPRIKVVKAHLYGWFFWLTVGQMMYVNHTSLQSPLQELRLCLILEILVGMIPWDLCYLLCYGKIEASYPCLEIF